MEKTLLDDIKNKKSDQREMIVNELGIFELRGLAREIGVPSPTTRKRGELVDLILEKLSNGSSVPQRPTKKGRPCKTLNNIDKIMSAMTGNEATLSFPSVTKRIRPYNEVITFAQETPVFSLIMEEETADFEGVLRVADKVGFFLDIKNNTKVFIPLDMVNTFGLKTGDYIEVTANKMNTSNQYIVSNLNKINFVDASEYKPVAATSKEPTISFNMVPYGDFKLFRGRRNIIRYQSNIFEDNRFYEFANNLIKDGFKVVVLSLNTSFEDAIMFDNIDGLIKLKNNYGDNDQTGLDKVVDAISLVLRLNELGEKVVLFINDIMEVLSYIDFYFDKKETMFGHNADAVVVIQKLISLGRAYKDESETTVVMTYRKCNENDPFLINEVLKVCTPFA